MHLARLTLFVLKLESVQLIGFHEKLFANCFVLFLIWSSSSEREREREIMTITWITTNKPKHCSQSAKVMISHLTIFDSSLMVVGLDSLRARHFAKLFSPSLESKTSLVSFFFFFFFFLGRLSWPMDLFLKRNKMEIWSGVERCFFHLFILNTAITSPLRLFISW